MNEALDKALKAQGITTPRARTQFALDVGITERSLRRWLHDDATPHFLIADAVARKLKSYPEELWPGVKS